MMIRFRPSVSMWRAAGAVALGGALGLGAAAAQAQVAVVRRPAPTYAGTYYPGALYTYGRPYGPGLFYGPGGYSGVGPNGYNSGSPVRDWSTGRNVPLAKPWMRPLR